MGANKYEVDSTRLEEIENFFRQIRINPNHYPRQTAEPDEFAKNFKPCSILKEGPTYSTNTSTPNK